MKRLNPSAVAEISDMGRDERKNSAGLGQGCYVVVFVSWGTPEVYITVCGGEES